MIEWDYGLDLVTIRYDAKKITIEGLSKEIVALGYKVEIVDDASRAASSRRDKKWRALIPDDAPKFFREAFSNAHAAGKPVIVDFWATWCGPCIRLKKETFADKNVAKLLNGVAVVFVDLDKYPELGESFRVDSVPNVLLIDRQGFVVDRLQNFEPPELFATRLTKLLKGEAGTEARNSIDVNELTPSIDPLRDWFNANKDRPRFITILSPT